MKPTQLFFDLVEHFEGLKLNAYKDVAGIWTIGYGITRYDNGVPVEEDDVITKAEAIQMLFNHVSTINLPTNLLPHQADACYDFCYNAGSGAFNGSTLKKDIIRDATADIITSDFEMWDKAHVDGELVEVEGLLRRRKCEAYLFINGQNHPTFYL